MEDLRKELSQIRRNVSGLRFAVKLMVLCLLTVAGAGLVLTGSPLGMGAGIILCGLMYAHALELQHEALHGIGFRSMRANTVAGFLLGLPTLTSFAAYQAAHMRHHRLLGTPDNREFFDYGDQYGALDQGKLRRVASSAYRFSMLGHYLNFAVTLAKLATGRSLPEEKPAAMRGIRRDYAIMVSVIAGATACTVLSGSPLLLWLWLVPLAVTSPVHALIELPEHYRCDTLTTDVLANTRTIRSNAFAAWFTNGNNFHVEHHLMPSLPIAQLVELHDALAGKHQHFHQTYRDFFRWLSTQGDDAPSDRVPAPAASQPL